jgi:divalent anion:Na+ symporter, DASS family
MAALGRRTLGLGYGLIATDLVLAPAIPSNTARAGGIVFPLVRASAKAFGSEPDDGTAHKIGAFLVQAAFQGNVITSAMFLTAMAANPLAAKLAGQMHINVIASQTAHVSSMYAAFPCRFACCRHTAAAGCSGPWICQQPFQ